MINFNIQALSPLVRKWPYPFSSAFSISNDIEFTSMEYFEVLMEYLNSNNETVFGTGLGLEVTNSMFFFNALGETVSYYCGATVDAKKSDYSDRLMEYVKAGLIDTNHAFGDFSAESRFTRRHAERVYEELSKYGQQLEIFSNHGGEYNCQGIGGADFRKGDVHGSPEYHSDLFIPNGVRYLWNESGMYEGESTLRLYLKNIRDNLFRRKFPLLPVGSFLSNYKLHDGTYLKAFWRYRATGFNAPNASSFLAQLLGVDWSKLFDEQGALVLYQHLGVDYRSAKKCFPMTLSKALSRPELYISPFGIIKRLKEEGKLWVIGLGRLLKYVDMIQTTKVVWDDKIESFIVSSEQPILDAISFFQGLTMYVDPARSVRVIYNGMDLPLWHNGCDSDKRYSVTVVLNKLENLW